MSSKNQRRLLLNLIFIDAITLYVLAFMPSAIIYMVAVSVDLGDPRIWGTLLILWLPLVIWRGFHLLSFISYGKSSSGVVANKISFFGLIVFLQYTYSFKRKKYVGRNILLKIGGLNQLNAKNRIEITVNKKRPGMSFPSEFIEGLDVSGA